MGIAWRAGAVGISWFNEMWGSMVCRGLSSGAMHSPLLLFYAQLSAAVPPNVLPLSTIYATRQP